MDACGCDQFKTAIDNKVIAFDGRAWHVNGCCSQCFVLSKILFCPFCGQPVPERSRATPGAGKTKMIYTADSSGQQKAKRVKQPPRVADQLSFKYEED